MTLVHTASIPVIEAVLQSSEENMLSVEQAALVFAGLFILGGVIVLYTSAKEPINRARKFLGVESFTSPQTIETDDIVAIDGVIRNSGTSVTGPFSDQECVAYVDEQQTLKRDWKYDREERQRMRRNDTFDEEEREKKVTSWHTTATDRYSVPFELETDHGTITVDPDDAELDLPSQQVEQSSWFKRFVHRVPLIGYLGNYSRSVGRPTRRIEKHVKPGDRVTVIGDLEEPESTDALGTVDAQDGNDLFMVTTKSRRRLAAQSIAGAVAASFPAIVLLTVGFLIIAVTAVTTLV